MARTRASRPEASSRQAKSGSRRGGPPISKPTKPTPSSLLAQATSFLHTSQPDDALPLALRALALLQSGPSNPIAATLPAVNLLADINLELGDGDAAREYFLQAVALDPNGSIPEIQGGGVEKYLWLAQLSEEGGEESVGWFEKGAEILRRDVGDSSLSEEAKEEKRKKLAGALCGIIEIYMTDLSWDPTAESTCERLITEALLLTPCSPTPLQTLASIRISQSSLEAARTALTQSLSLWADLPPEDQGVPDFATRIQLARLLMEVEMLDEAKWVAERLVGEDDGSVEAWYLGGWGMFLLARRKRESGEKEEGKEGWRECVRESREWLGNCLVLCEKLGYEDERLREHAGDLVRELDGELGGEEDEEGEDGGSGEAEWESEDEEQDDHDDENDDKDKNEDHEMHGA